MDPNNSLSSALRPLNTNAGKQPRVRRPERGFQSSVPDRRATFDPTRTEVAVLVEGSQSCHAPVVSASLVVAKCRPAVKEEDAPRQNGCGQ